jgi:putative transposase
VKKRFIGEQIIGSLKQPGAGAPIKELCRIKASATEVLRAGCSRRQAPEGPRGGERQLKKMLAEAMLDNEALKVVARGKILSPQARRNAVVAGWARTQLAERRASHLLGPSRSVLRHTWQRNDDGLRQRLVELTVVRRRFGYRRLHIMAEREPAWPTTSAWRLRSGRCRSQPHTPRTSCSTPGQRQADQVPDRRRRLH